MIKDVFIDVPLINQKEDTHDKKWTHRTCAICSLKMVLVWKNKKLEKLPVMKLVNEGLKLDGYMKGVGWEHKTLVDLAGQHGVRMSFVEKFFRTKTQKTKGLGMINKKLAAGEPVLVSVFYKFNKENGGHVVVLYGLRKNKNKITGYFIQDPHPEFRGHNYFVYKKYLIDNWRGGLIFPV